MCDERGASAIAPPPILQARDVKIDAAPFGCDGPDFVMARVVARARTSGGVVVDDIAFQEAWVRPATERLPSPMSGQALAGAQDPFPASSAHVRGVFRPPRS